MNNGQHEFFTQTPIKKLLLKFAVPAIIAMLVNSLYNIVDQIFIGNSEVGFLGNAATNVTFPFVTVNLALALLVGEGSASYFSLNLGKKLPQVARKVVGNALLVNVIFGGIIALVGMIFTKELVALFGGTTDTSGYAIEYLRIVAIGTPFVMINISMGSLARADGTPNHAMKGMLVGTIINVVLDPIFIFGFHWGMTGAALATIIGQFVNCLFILTYLKQFKNVHIAKDCFKLDVPVASGFLTLGLSSFLNQFAMSIVIISVNNLIAKYGMESVYGADIPMAAIGIVMKVNQIMMAIIIGLSVGSQAILGYNYGAGNYERVLETYFTTLKLTTLVAVTGFAIFHIFPQQIINIFGSEEGLYNEFALRTFRIMLAGIVFVGAQMSSSVFFQAIGKPMQATIISLTRQVVFFIPLLFGLTYLMGIDGVLYSAPIADTLAFIATAMLVVFEVKRIKRQIAQGVR